MKILVTGATGLVGKRLCAELIRKNHELVIVSSSNESSLKSHFSYPCQYLNWNHFELPKNIEAVIHLAGASIASGRWTPQRKRAILESRTKTSRQLFGAFEKAGYWPKTFIGASAIGFYGAGEDQFFSEDDPGGDGFLANVCKSWEDSQKLFESKSRLVQLRIGVVLDSRGGMLGKLEPLFTKGLGGVVGSGKQWMSWIHWKDLQKMFIWALESQEAKGVFNAVAPNPVTNKIFTDAFSKKLLVSAPFPAPSFALKVTLGEMSELALKGQKVSCKKVCTQGFNFDFVNLEEALGDIYSWKQHSQDQIFFSDQYFPISKNKVYSFFSNAKNLGKITPKSLNFRVLSQSTPSIQEGTTINYKLKIHGVPIKWRTLIKKWNPDTQFIDTQEIGPYDKWHHTHTFSDFEKGTLMTDEVIYRIPMGWFGNTFGGWFVKKDVNNIFSHRTNVLDELMPEISKGDGN